MFYLQTLYLQYQQYLTIDFISHDFKFHYVLFTDSVSSVPAVLNIEFISHDFKFHYVLFIDCTFLYQQYLTIDFISHDLKFHYVLFIDSVPSVPAVLNYKLYQP